MLTTHNTNTCPVPADTIVRVDLGDGKSDENYIGRAGSWNWGPGLGDDGEGRIHGYEVLSAEAQLRHAA